MGYMLIDLMVVTCRIGMTRLEMAGSWIFQIREVMDIGTILVLVLIGTMIIIVIIFTGGVKSDICRMSLRNISHLLLMEI